MTSVLAGKVAIRKDGAGGLPWAVHWRGRHTDALVERDYEHWYRTHGDALDHARYLLAAWSRTPALVSPPAVREEAQRWDSVTFRGVGLSGEWIAADGGGYLPGTYATREAAERALRVAKHDFAALDMLVAFARRPLTLDDLAPLEPS